MFIYTDACEAEIPEIVQVHLKCFKVIFSVLWEKRCLKTITNSF